MPRRFGQRGARGRPSRPGDEQRTQDCDGKRRKVGKMFRTPFGLSRRGPSRFLVHLVDQSARRIELTHSSAASYARIITYAIHVRVDKRWTNCVVHRTFTQSIEGVNTIAAGEFWSGGFEKHAPLFP